MGSQFRHGHVFRGPLSCRRAEFPRSGWKSWPLVGEPSHAQRGSSAGSHLISALPLSGRCVPSPARTLLLGHRSYGLIRQSHPVPLSSPIWTPATGLSLWRSVRARFPSSGWTPTRSLARHALHDGDRLKIVHLSTAVLRHCMALSRPELVLSYTQAPTDRVQAPRCFLLDIRCVANSRSRFAAISCHIARFVAVDTKCGIYRSLR